MSLPIPLAVRLKTARTDRHVTRDLRDLGFRSTIPGGFASCEIALDRPLSIEAAEIRLYGEMFVYDGRNGGTVWQGRLEDPGRGSGPSGEIWTVRALGPSAHARDRTVPLIYVDRSLERWFHYGEGTTHPDGQQDVGDDLGGSRAKALNLRFPKGAVLATNNLIGREHRHLREFGQKLARFDYTFDAGVNPPANDWKAEAVTRSATGGQVPRTQVLASTGSGAAPKVVVTDFANGRDLLEIRLFYGGAGETVGSDAGWLSVMGLVLLAMRFNKDGTEKTSGYTANTVRASEIVEDLLGRLLTEYDGTDARVDATTFGIEQLAYPDGATPERILSDLMGLASNFYWAAWEDTSSGKSRFEWRAWPTTVRYEASARGGFDSPGSAVDLYDRVRVRWRDVDGRIRSTLRTQTVQALTDAGLNREALIDLGDEVASSANADRAGDQFLADHASPPNAGSLTVSGRILDRDLGRMVDPWEIRPGHLIRIREVMPRVDALNVTARDAVTVFRVVGHSYDAARNEAALELDSPPRTLSSLAGRTEPARRR